MPISGASPKHPGFLSDALRSQRRCPEAVPSRWQDEFIALAGSDDVLTCIHNNLVLFFSGRLINNPELSEKLGEKQSHSPRNILQAYQCWGDDFPRYLLGDFALALWDSQNHRLVLARDAVGYRPLHYWVRGDKFRFASEARGLFAHGDLSPAADERKIGHWLTRIPEPSGATFFQGISSVPPGHTVVWERGRVTLRDFWRPSNIPLLRLSDPREYAEGLRSVLEQAVSDRVRPFAAVGSHLSGGLDSSSVTAVAAGILRERGGRLSALSAFTAVPSVAIDDANFPGRFCDESSHAAATVALYPAIEHVLIPTTSGSVFESLDRMSSAAECPQLNPGNTCWIYAICAEAASRGIPVMLTGAGGNFTISYDGRRALSTLLSGGQMLASIRLARGLRRNGNTWPSIMQLAGRPHLSSRARRALDWLRGARSLKVEDATGVCPRFAASLGFTPQQALDSAETLDGRSLRIWSIRRNDFGGHISALQRLTGVEQTDPTTDRRVMDFCLSVPEEHYRANGRSRSLLRDAMSARLPPKVLNERRIGRQSADLVFHLTRDRAEIAAELQRLKKIDLAVRCLSLPLLESLVESWPAPPYGRADHMRYGTLLMRAVSMGRFIRRLEEGTLFNDPLPLTTGSRL
ncbi:MAG: asparagine synthase-related protein [Terriglobia bacterium]